MAGAGASAGNSIFLLIYGALAAILLVSAALIWRRNRVGFIISIVISAIFLLAFGFDILGALSGFADLGRFLETITLLPPLLLTLVNSILGLRRLWRRNTMQTPKRMIPLSSVLAILAVGFAIGGASIGLLASGVVSTLAGNSNVKADITIVQGASNTGTLQPFMPATFSVKVGTSVTWVNRDPVSHTVTSTSVPSGAKSFDSGNLPYGFAFTVTFTTPGTYQYYCSIHPSMRGTIVVTP